jgi:hypothetical protein
MSDEKKKPLHPARSIESKEDVRDHPAHSTESERDVRGLPETNFLPPLKMVLTFLDRDKKQKEVKKQEGSDEKNVEKLIEKLSEKEE